jgi:hypothetical protein
VFETLIVADPSGGDAHHPARVEVVLSVSVPVRLERDHGRATLLQVEVDTSLNPTLRSAALRRPKTVSVQSLPSGEGRNRIPARVGCEQLAEVGEQRAALQATGDRCREQPLDMSLSEL